MKNDYKNTRKRYKKRLKTAKITLYTAATVEWE